MPEQEFNREKIVGTRFERSIALEAREMNLDEESRTVELAFSSAEPCYHWFGYLKLDHAKSSVRMDRLEKAGALLWAHDSRQQIGAVESISIDEKAGVCRAVVKFSDSVQGDENFRDVKNGIKRSVSFGFLIYDLEPEVGKDGKPATADDGEMVYVSRDWEPFEISLVSIPADISVGVGRSLEDAQTISNKNAPIEGANSINKRNKVMPEENSNPATPETTEQTRTAAPATAPAVQSPEVTRAAEFAAFGEVFGETELARTIALDPAKTLSDVRAAILAKREAAQVVIPPASPESVAARSGQPVELARSVYRGAALKAFKGARAQEEAYRSGMFLRATLLNDEKAIAFCREKGISLERDMTGTNNTQGGFLVPAEFENSIIDLRIEYGVFRANSRVVPMGSDVKNQPRRTGGLTAYAVGPGQAGTESTPSYDLIELIARKWMVLADYEVEFSEDAIISAADTLASEIAYAFTYAEDNAGFNGTGLSATHGIVGIISQLTAATAGLMTASGNAWSEIVEADILGVIGKLPQFARKSGNVKWYCSHTFWATVLQRLALAKGGVTLAEVQGKMMEVAFGYPVEIVEVMPTTEANSQIPLLFGNLSQASTFGDRRGVTVSTADQHASNWASDILSIKGTERFDINVHDVGDTTNAGAIVGLITASS